MREDHATITAYVQTLNDEQLFWLGLNTFLVKREDVRACVLAEQARRQAERQAARARAPIVKATYGHFLRWTPGPFQRTQTYEVHGYPTREAAWESVRNSAIREGWTPPQWWQCWRWHDTRVPHWYQAQPPAGASSEGNTPNA